MATLHRSTSDGHQLRVEARDGLRMLIIDGVCQSVIDPGDPARLPDPANRAMVAPLLFVQTPRSVLLGGCGGGGVARWFAARAPQTHGTAVECSDAVADLAHAWFDFPPFERGWQLVIDDLRRFLPTTPERYDFVLIDLEERGRTPAWVVDRALLEAARAALTPGGVLALNLLVDGADALREALARLRAAFTCRTLCLSVPGRANLIALAFNRPPPAADLDARALAAQARWGIDFPTLLARMRRENPPGSGVL